MKNYLIICFYLLLVSAVVPTEEARFARIKFEETTFNYGKITENDIVEHEFKFKNVGNADLIIKDAQVTCGCTTPSYSFLPIAPGKSGVIGVRFDSHNKIGAQRPTVTVVTNGRPAIVKLYMEGDVKYVPLAEQEKQKKSKEEAVKN